MNQMTDWRGEFAERGYVVLRGLLAGPELEAARAEAGRLYAAWKAQGAVPEQPNVRYLERTGGDGVQVLDGIQGGFRLSPQFAALRGHPKLAAQLKQQLGDDIVTVVDTLFFKPCGQSDTGIAFHRDAEFRQPPESFRNLDRSYVQVGMALEDHGPENGGLLFAPGSHLRPEVTIGRTGSVRGIGDVMETLKTDASLELEAVKMSPGDVVFWSANVIHGSPANLSADKSRKFYVVGYMAKADCDRGVPVFI